MQRYTQSEVIFEGPQQKKKYSMYFAKKKNTSVNESKTEYVYIYLTLYGIYEVDP